MFERRLRNTLSFKILKRFHNGYSEPILDKDIERSQWKEVKLVVHSAKYPVDDMPTLYTSLGIPIRDHQAGPNCP